jgi:hypothetical protein
MIVQKKGDRDNEGQSSSAMMVGEHEEQDAEDELYNLMRRATSLMITDNVDGSEDSGEDDDSEEESVEENTNEEEKVQNSSVVHEGIEAHYAAYIHDLLPKE